MRDFGNKHGFTFVDTPDEANIIVSVGGDGTFLQAVHQTNFRSDCLYIGIGTGGLDFYCDFDLYQPEPLLRAMLNEHIKVRRYPVLEVTIDDEGSFYCLNECSLRSSIIKTFVIDLYIDDLYFETFRGDGLIISTPTGSTAYNKSVHGAVVDPKLSCFQVSELASINNNRFRTLGSPFLLSGQRTLTLQFVDYEKYHPIVGIDHEALNINDCREIIVRLSERKIKTVKRTTNSFWHKVKRSFL